MSVGRFQLALRALDLRAAPCPRGLLRPTTGTGGLRREGHFVASNPALHGAHEHLGGAFANFGSQAVFLCSESAEATSDRIDSAGGTALRKYYPPIRPL